MSKIHQLRLPNGTTYDLVEGVMTTPVTCAVGSTSVTISDANISTSSTIHVQSQTSSGKPLAWTSVVATTGQAVITFKSALTESTDVRLKILNI